jgi:peptidoglycan hydrolase CwlO-like protein
MFRRNEEERFDIILVKPELRALADLKRTGLEEKVDELSRQMNVLSKYLSHLSKKIDDALALIRVQEEKIKDLESRIEALTAREI